MKFDFYITGTIGEEYDWWTGQRGTTANQVKAFLDNHKDEELTIAVSSYGGYIDDGIAICEYIKGHGNCNMVIIGMTASAATILCMKAKSVKIARGSMMLIHNSASMLDVWTTANKEKIDEIIKSFQHERDQLDTIDKCLADIYSMRNGKTLDENLDMMAQEKWLSAQDALDFGLVDAILDDDEKAAIQVQSIKNAYTGFKGASEHYCFPSMGDMECKDSKSLFQRMRDALSKVSGIMNDVESSVNTPSTPSSNQSTLIMNKTFVKVNALLKVEGLEESGDGVVMTTAQLQVVEDALAELQGKVENHGNLEKELADAQQAKDTAESNLSKLQKEFDDFKKEVGDDSPRIPAGGENALSSAELFNQVKPML